MTIETVAHWIFGGIVLIVIGFLFWFVFILLPYRVAFDAIQVLIGRPFGFGWIPVRAEMRPEEQKTKPPVTAGKAEADYKYAIYTVDGTEYRMPYFRKVKEDHLKLYVLKKSPRVIWTPGCDDRSTALVGLLLILGLWVGLVLSAICIVQAVRG